MMNARTMGESIYYPDVEVRYEAGTASVAPVSWKLDERSLLIGVLIGGVAMLAIGVLVVAALVVT